MRKGPTKTYYAIALIIGALALWGLYLAVGAYLGPGNEWAPERFDIRRGLVVLACMGAFLLFWAGLLWNRQRQLKRRDANPSDHE